MSINVTVDDFDPIIGYSDYTQWSTPNPQDNPTWYNASSSVTGVPWHEATYHYTTTPGASLSFNFTGSAVSIYGSAAPNGTYTGQFGVSLDSVAHNETVSSAGSRVLLFEQSGLSSGNHQATITNYGSNLLIDLIVFDAVVGTSSATLSNSTIDDGAVQYTGTWGSETGDFFGGTSTYCQGPGNAFSFNFTGSAVYLFGDQVNDHGLYTVSINNTAYATLNGRSGCGGGYAKYCEKLGGLKFFTSGLPAGQHTLKLENEGPSSGNETFFDFDYAVYTTPSVYLASNTTSSPSASSSSSPSSSALPSASSRSSKGWKVDVSLGLLAVSIISSLLV